MDSQNTSEFPKISQTLTFPNSVNGNGSTFDSLMEDVRQITECNYSKDTSNEPSGTKTQNSTENSPKESICDMVTEASSNSNNEEDSLPQSSGYLSEDKTSDGSNAPNENELEDKPHLFEDVKSNLNENEQVNGDQDQIISKDRTEIMDTSAEAAEESTLDTRRKRRSVKRMRESGESCPVCSVTIRFPDLETHYAQEVDKLTKISKNLKKPRNLENAVNKTLEQVKRNRESRITAKVAKYQEKAKNEVQCPICKLHFTDSPEKVNNHVIRCPDLGFLSDTDDDAIIIDDDESFEEYVFADQTRTRPISLVPGGYRALNGITSISTGSQRGEDEDLNVDVDDTLTYGKAQYTELDVIANALPKSYAEDQLRKAVIMNSTERPHVLEHRKWSNFTAEDDDDKPLSDRVTEEKSEWEIHVGDTDDKDQENKPGTSGESQHKEIESSSTEEVKDLKQNDTKDVKCLICLDNYTKPVVSTTCWHVYCEECWLMTMGVKKLCPQCNMIVFPRDLRRIFL